MKRKTTTKTARNRIRGNKVTGNGGGIGIYVGASRDSVQAAREVILEIIATKAAPEVLVEALTTLGMLCQTNNATISHCNITGV